MLACWTVEDSYCGRPLARAVGECLQGVRRLTTERNRYVVLLGDHDGEVMRQRPCQRSSARAAKTDMSAIEPLHSPRPPQPLDAVYLLTPTSQNVDRIIADFSNGRKTYKSAYLYFIDGKSFRVINIRLLLCQVSTTTWLISSLRKYLGMSSRRSLSFIVISGVSRLIIMLYVC
jgi:hypothetical protein